MRRLRRNGLGGSVGRSGGGLGPCWLWRNFATTGARANEHEVYVPFARSAGSVRYGVYSFGRYGGDVVHPGRMKVGTPVANVWHGDLVKTGTWSTTSEGRIPQGSTARSNAAGDTIGGTIAGHTLLLRYYTNVNGGFGIVGIDGDETSADRLPSVQASDFRAVEDVTNQGGVCRVTSGGHGLATGASVIVEGVVGVAGANGSFEVTRLDDDAFLLEGSTFSGSYAGGGTFGFFAQADLGRRYLEFYSTASGLFDEHAPLASGLADESHTVEVRVVGTARAGGASGKRVYLTGIAGATAGLRLGTVGTSMGYLQEIGNLRSPAYSALGTAIEFRPSGGSTLHWIGENHGEENELSATWELDGSETTPTPDEYRAGGMVRLQRTSELTHPEAVGAVATREASYSAHRRQRTPLRLRERITWLAEGTAERAYHGMLHVGVRKYAASQLEQRLFDRASIGDRIVADLGYDDDASRGETIAEQATFWENGELGFEAGLLSYDPAKNVNGWALSNPFYLFLFDRGDGTEKLYFARSTSTNPESVVVGAIHESDVGWFVRPQRAARATASDRFQRIDGETPGTTDGRWDGGGGRTWETLAGSWGIVGGRLTPTGSDPGGGWRIGVDVDSTDGLCEAETAASSSGDVGLLVRYVGESDFWVVEVSGGNLVVKKVQGGASTTEATTAGPDGALQRLWASCQGNELRAGAVGEVGATRLTVDASGGPMGTQFGVASGEVGGRWEGFAMYAAG